MLNWNRWKSPDRRWLFLAWLLILVGWLPFLRHLGEVPKEDDWMLVLHGVEGFRRSLVLFGQLPIWNPWDFGGMPGLGSPASGIFSLDILLACLFGSVAGLKLTSFLYMLIGATGMWQLTGLYFKRPELRCWAAVLFGLQGTFAIHIAVGHTIMLGAAWLPWLFFLALRFRENRWNGLWFGLIFGLLLHQGIHYIILMASLIFTVFFLWQLLRHPKDPLLWRNLVGAALVFWLVAGYKIVISYDLYTQFPREMSERHAFSILIFLKALVWPLQTLATGPVPLPGMWRWHEIGSYVGIIAVLSALISLRGGLRWWHWLGLATFLLVFDSASPWLPGYWLRELPLFKSVYVFTRWRFITVFCIILAAVQGMQWLYEYFHGNRRIIWIERSLIGCSILLLLVSQFSIFGSLQWLNHARLLATIPYQSPTVVTTNQLQLNSYAAVAKGVSLPLTFQPMFGYKIDYQSNRIPCENANYRGEIASTTGGLTGYQWTPNRITLQVSAPDRIYINQNTSDYWRSGDRFLFPRSRSIETLPMFFFDAPEPGTYQIRAVPPQHELGLIVTALSGLLLAGWLWLLFRKKPVTAPPVT